VLVPFTGNGGSSPPSDTSKWERSHTQQPSAGSGATAGGVADAPWLTTDPIPATVPAAALSPNVPGPPPSHSPAEAAPRGGGPGEATAPGAGPGTGESMATYAQTQRSQHRLRAIAGSAAGPPPPLPVRCLPAGDAAAVADIPPALPDLLRLPQRYHGQIPLVRRLQAGRLTVADLIESLGWTPGARLFARLGPRWVYLSLDSDSDSDAGAGTQRTCHVTAKGAVAFSKGLRAYLGVDAGGQVVVRTHPATGELAVANAALLAFALDTIERLDAAASVRAADVGSPIAPPLLSLTVPKPSSQPVSEMS
jgi:hypothetical protein